MRRNGYTDFAIPMKFLRDALADQVRADIRMPHDQLVRFGVEKILNVGLFDKYADEFKGYIVTNALNMALDDIRANGIDPVTGLAERARSPRTAQEVEEQAQARTERATVLVDKIKQIVIMDLMSPLGKPYGDCSGEEMAKIGGWAASIAKRIKPRDRVRDKLTEADLHKARGF